MTTQQLEMPLNGSNRCRRFHRRDLRRSRARWWFNQMRLVVDSALDWRPTPPPRPEQTHLTLSPSTGRITWF